MPVTGDLKPFSFKGRRYLEPIYNTNSKRVLLQCGRQVEKSTTLGNLALTYSILQRHFRTLFVSPTQQQTETFSRDKVATPIELSEKLKIFAQGRGTKDNVLYKKFITGSDITLRYAFLHADRIRGISADLLLLDEIQDILTEVIPVIEEALSHSQYKILRYSGTPKSLDNTISYYWENYSTQNEWVIPCDSCGGGDYRHWNITGEKNIGLKYLICDRCGKQIFPNHPEAQWASMNPNPPTSVPFEGYRIPQLIAAWTDWNEIIDKKNRYTRRQFFNEVLGRGYDAGDRPLTKSAIRACCESTLSMHPPPGRLGGNEYFLGVDWGTGENTYTVMALGHYVGGRFRVILMKRFEGDEAEPQRVLNSITEIVNKYQVSIIGADYGGGYDRNDTLIRRHGLTKVARYQYVNTNKKVYFDKALSRFMVNRTAVLMDIINAINRGNNFIFPRWEEFEHPFAQDMVNIYSEYRESRRAIILDRTPGTTDDSLHAITYCFLASMIKYPRPDILSPIGDEKYG